MKNKLIKVVFLIMFKVGAQVSDFKHISFKKANKIVRLHKGESLKNIATLTHKLTNELQTDVEKFRAIYLWICKNVDYDFEIYQRISLKRETYKNDPEKFIKWNINYRKHIFKQLIENKKTVCTGYAYLLQQMAYIAGIECKLINGYGRNSSINTNEINYPNHTWNAVKLNNKWYLCDPTWSSGFLNDDSEFIHQYNNGYFLTKPKLFARNHQPLNKKWTLLNVPPSNNSFVSKPIVYDTTFQHNISPTFPDELFLQYEKSQHINFEYRTENPIDLNKISLIYFDENDQEVSLPLSNFIYHEGIIKFYTKILKKGNYDVHLKYGNDYIISYMIQII